MTGNFDIRIIGRREVLLSAAAGAGLAALMTALPVAAHAANDIPSERSEAFWKKFKEVTGEAKPVEEKVTLVLDEIAENGNNVPFDIAVDSPMTGEDSIKTLHLLSTANPQPAVAAFHFSPLSGKAAVKGRMRLAKTQDVIALAEKADGSFLIATRRIEVTIGGCGN